MRVLVLSNLYPPHYLGGYELICQQVAQGLKERGHEVEVLTSNHVVEGAGADAPGVRVWRELWIHGFYGHPWLGIRRLAKLEQHNNEVLRRRVEQYRPDLVYVCNMGGLSKSLLLTLERLNVVTAFYISDHWIVRGIESDVWVSWWSRRQASWAHRAARELARWSGIRRKLDQRAPIGTREDFEFRRIYFCSAALRRLTEEAGFAVGHGAVIYCPVDVEKFSGEPRVPDGLCDRLLYVGRLAEDKGVTTALNALSILKQRGKRVRVDIYGRGDSGYVQRLMDQAEREELPVVFNHASPEQMPEIYRRYDALLFTSEWEEPFALTPLEAMASGLPVIGTTTGGSAELFRHGKNALTYEAGQPDQLAARIEEFCDDAELRHRCAVEGQQDVRKKCAAGVIVGQVEAFLEESWRSWRRAE